MKFISTLNSHILYIKTFFTRVIIINNFNLKKKNDNKKKLLKELIYKFKS